MAGGTVIPPYDPGPPGRDYWRDKAAHMFGVPYESVTPEQRKYAKNMSFARMYGYRGGGADAGTDEKDR
jgi:DNA polymerase I-like protein with 3'-5' exonuclease and polymerase domains